MAVAALFALAALWVSPALSTPAIQVRVGSPWQDSCSAADDGYYFGDPDCGSHKSTQGTDCMRGEYGATDTLAVGFNVQSPDTPHLVLNARIYLLCSVDTNEDFRIQVNGKTLLRETRAHYANCDGWSQLPDSNYDWQTCQDIWKLYCYKDVQLELPALGHGETMEIKFSSSIADHRKYDEQWAVSDIAVFATKPVVLRAGLSWQDSCSAQDDGYFFGDTKFHKSQDHVNCMRGEYGLPDTHSIGLFVDSDEKLHLNLNARIYLLCSADTGEDFRISANGQVLIAETRSSYASCDGWASVAYHNYDWQTCASQWRSFCYKDVKLVLPQVDAGEEMKIQFSTGINDMRKDDEQWAVSDISVTAAKVLTVRVGEPWKDSCSAEDDAYYFGDAHFHKSKDHVDCMRGEYSRDNTLEIGLIVESPDSARLTLKARIYLLCSVDTGEHFRIEANGEELMTATRASASNCGGWSSIADSNYDWQTCHSDWRSFCYKDVQLELPELAAGEQMEITFSSSIDQGGNDEQWAVSGISITASEVITLGVGETWADSCSAVDDAYIFGDPTHHKSTDGTDCMRGEYSLEDTLSIGLLVASPDMPYVNLHARIYLLCSVDAGEAFTITMNGEEALRATRESASNCNGWAEWPDENRDWQTCHSDWRSFCYKDVSVALPKVVSGEEVEVRFSSSINQGGNDEQWAVSDISIAATQVLTIRAGHPWKDVCSAEDDAYYFGDAYFRKSKDHVNCMRGEYSRDDTMSIGLIVESPDAPHLTLKARIYLLCSVDAGEHFRITANGEELLTATRASASNCGGWSSIADSNYDWQTCHSSWRSFCYRDVQLELPELAVGEQMEITFSTSIDQGGNDEQWAISDISIAAAQVLTVRAGNPWKDSCSDADDAYFFGQSYLRKSNDHVDCMRGAYSLDDTLEIGLIVKSPDSARLTLKARIYLLCSVDAGEHFRIKANGQELLTATRASASNCGGWSSIADNNYDWQTCHSSWRSFCYRDVQLELPELAVGEQMEITFSSSINQGGNDEQWAVSGISITASEVVTVHCGETWADSCSATDDAYYFGDPTFHKSTDGTDCMRGGYGVEDTLSIGLQIESPDSPYLSLSARVYLLCSADANENFRIQANGEEMFIATRSSAVSCDGWSELPDERRDWQNCHDPWRTFCYQDVNLALPKLSSGERMNLIFSSTIEQIAIDEQWAVSDISVTAPALLTLGAGETWQDSCSAADDAYYFGDPNFHKSNDGVNCMRGEYGLDTTLFAGLFVESPDTPHLRLSARIYLLCSVDAGEAFTITANGEEVLRATRESASNCNGWSELADENRDWQTCHSSWRSFCFRDVELELPKLPVGEQMEIVFSSSINQGGTDEQWAVSDISIAASAVVTLAAGETWKDSCNGADDAHFFGDPYFHKSTDGVDCMRGEYGKDDTLSIGFLVESPDTPELKLRARIYLLCSVDVGENLRIEANGEEVLVATRPSYDSCQGWSELPDESRDWQTCHDPWRTFCYKDIEVELPEIAVGDDQMEITFSCNINQGKIDEQWAVGAISVTAKADPTASPSYEPTVSPTTSHPTLVPTDGPTPAPTDQPTDEPSYDPTNEPSASPTISIDMCLPMLDAIPAPQPAPQPPAMRNLKLAFAFQLVGEASMQLRDVQIAGQTYQNAWCFDVPVEKLGGQEQRVGMAEDCWVALPNQDCYAMRFRTITEIRTASGRFKVSSVRRVFPAGGGQELVDTEKPSSNNVFDASGVYRGMQGTVTFHGAVDMNGFLGVEDEYMGFNIISVQRKNN